MRRSTVVLCHHRWLFQQLEEKKVVAHYFLPTTETAFYPTVYKKINEV
jgi:hypothetical protein